MNIEQHTCFVSNSIYPALTGSKTPSQNSAEAKKLGGGWAARKIPIGEG
ncbi:spermidine/putrescine ABC transporter ATP-binding protein [Bacillus cereus]